MPFSEDDKDMLRLLISEGVSAGFNKHRIEDHEPLREKVESTDKKVAWGMGAAAALGALIHKIMP